MPTTRAGRIVADVASSNAPYTDIEKHRGITSDDPQ